MAKVVLLEFDVLVILALHGDLLCDVLDEAELHDLLCNVAGNAQRPEQSVEDPQGPRVRLQVRESLDVLAHHLEERDSSRLSAHVHRLQESILEFGVLARKSDHS